MQNCGESRLSSGQRGRGYSTVKIGRGQVWKTEHLTKRLELGAVELVNELMNLFQKCVNVHRNDVITTPKYVLHLVPAAPDGFGWLDIAASSFTSTLSIILCYSLCSVFTGKATVVWHKGISSGGQRYDLEVFPRMVWCSCSVLLLIEICCDCDSPLESKLSECMEITASHPLSAPNYPVLPWSLSVIWHVQTTAFIYLL